MVKPASSDGANAGVKDFVSNRPMMIWELPLLVDGRVRLCSIGRAGVLYDFGRKVFEPFYMLVLCRAEHGGSNGYSQSGLSGIPIHRIENL